MQSGLDKANCRENLKFNRYGDSFSNVMELVVGPDERMISNDIDLMDKRNNDCVEDQSESEIEFEQVVEQTHENEKKKRTRRCVDDFKIFFVT